MRPVSLLALTAALALGACAAPGDFPSLKPRAFELAGRDPFALPPQPPPVPARPEITARAAALLARGEAGQRAFVAELPRARPVIAHAGPADSDSWIVAQEQLSALDASRAETTAALAELDAITPAGVDPAGARLSEADLAVLRGAGDQLHALAAEQQSELARLASSLAAP